MSNLSLIINLFGGSFRGSIDNRTHVYHLTKHLKSDVIVWDFYNGISNDVLQKLIGKPGVNNAKHQANSVPSKGIENDSPSVLKFAWDESSAFNQAMGKYVMVEPSNIISGSRYHSLTIFILAHGNLNCPAFENDSGSQVNPHLLLSAVFHNLFKPFPAGLGLSHTLSHLHIDLQVCNSWLGDNSIKESIVKFFTNRKISNFMKYLLPVSRSISITGFERVTYSIPIQGYPERSKGFDSKLRELISTANGVSTEDILRGGKLKKDNLSCMRDDSLVKLRSAAVAFLEGELNDNETDNPETKKLKKDQLKLMKQLKYKEEDYGTYKEFGKKFSPLKKSSKHILTITFWDAYVELKDQKIYHNFSNKKNVPLHVDLPKSVLLDDVWLLESVPRFSVPNWPIFRMK